MRKQMTNVERSIHEESERIDTVKLVAPNNIRKHDVVLYMRNDKTLVLHRIIRINNDEFMRRMKNANKI